jgi:two-component system cell cycle sensor histidine kinase/response regulator CckA
MPNPPVPTGTLLQTILENVEVGIAVLDTEGKIVFTNQSALTMVGMRSFPAPVRLEEWSSGYRFQDSLGRDIPLLEFAALRTLAGEQVEPEHIRVTLPDGRTKWFHISSHRFSVMGLTGVLIIIIDETTTVELRRAAAQLQRMDDVSAIAAGLAHNFNNILSTISLSADIALMEEGVPESIRGRLRQISEASWKAAALVKRLMQFGRRRELQVQRVQISSLVTEALNLVLPLLQKIQVHTNVGQGIPEVEIDPTEIEQVLVNLIMNARDAMPEGGELTITTELEDSTPAAASTEGEGQQQFVVISVADTGTGIAEEIQPQIFEPFFTTKTAEKGTGLGLSSAHGIVKQHRGKITVWSEPGKGTKFTVHLPLSGSPRNVTRAA